MIRYILANHGRFQRIRAWLPGGYPTCTLRVELPHSYAATPRLVRSEVQVRSPGTHTQTPVPQPPPSPTRRPASRTWAPDQAQDRRPMRLRVLLTRRRVLGSPRVVLCQPLQVRPDVRTALRDVPRGPNAPLCAVQPVQRAYCAGGRWRDADARTRRSLRAIPEPSSPDMACGRVVGALAESSRAPCVPSFRRLRPGSRLGAATRPMRLGQRML